MLATACLLLAGCFGGPSPGPRRPDADAGPAVRIEHGIWASRTGCSLRYSRYSTRDTRPGALVVVGHGFLRSQARMAGLAKALARAGWNTLTLDFCHDHLWTGGHIRNGLDMMGLAREQGAGRVVYVGFSAGGLAALIAAREDPRAVGVVGLDLVDADGLGVRMAAGLERPLIGLVGEPSACNAYNNGLAVYAAARATGVRRFPAADHCDFESETDWLCNLVCAQGSSSPAAVRRGIQEATVAAVDRLLAGRKVSAL